MKCPVCEGKTKVLDVVHGDIDNEDYRRRKCLDCGYELYTAEIEVEYDERYKNNWLRNHRWTERRRRKNNEHTVQTGHS